MTDDLAPIIMAPSPILALRAVIRLYLRDGADTAAIASAMGLREADIWNLLAETDADATLRAEFDA